MTKEFTYFILFSLVPRFRLDSGLGETGSKTSGGSGVRRSHRSEGSSVRRSDVFQTFSEDMEEELEKTKVVKAFWDLRQEVRRSASPNLFGEFQNFVRLLSYVIPSPRASVFFFFFFFFCFNFCLLLSFF